MKINTLTPAQQELICSIRDKWLNKLFGCNRRIDRAKATEGINWLYEISGFQKPMIMYVDSPLVCQSAYHFINSIVKANTDQVEAQVWEQPWDQVRDQVDNQLFDQAWNDWVWNPVDSWVLCKVRDQVWDLVLDQVNDEVWNQVWDQLLNHVNQVDQMLNQVRHEVLGQVNNQDRYQEFFHFSSFGNVGNYGWLAFYDYFKTIGVLQHENFDKFSNFIDSGIYDMIQLENFCIISELPVKISRNNQNRLHCEGGSAIEWADGYSQYYWNGLPVPKKLIETPHLITKEEILKESNAELRRCMREKLGVEEYYNRLGGVILIDEDTDDQGNIMKLLRSKEIDAVINKYVQYLQVICPSTKREYILYPPNQNSTNVWDAKASTFQDDKIQYRHGDVGLLNVNKEFPKPSIES